MRGPSCSTDSAADGASDSAADCDHIAVIGAGPAGCAAAIRLARLGYAVHLVDGGGRGRPLALESSSPALLPLLDALGVDADAAGVRPSAGTWVQWATPAEAVDAGDAGRPGLRVERALFDPALRRAAALAGAVLLPARARPPQRGTGGRWQVALHDGRRIDAAGLVLATGRAGLAMPGLPPTAALCGHWPAAAQAGGPTRARVQAIDDAWAWSASGDDGAVSAALFVDSARLKGLDAAARLSLYRTALGRFSLLAPLLRGPAPRALRVADATPRRAALPAEPGLVRAGEAAVSLDPLSSQGLASALRSGLQAAVCLHTMLQRPADAVLARHFHREQVEREALRHALWCAGYHASAAGRFGSSFWVQRAKCAAMAEVPRVPETSLAAPAGPSFGGPAPDTPVGLDHRARCDATAQLAGDWIVAAPALQHPGLAAPVGFVQGVAVGHLIHALQSGRPVPAGRLLQRWSELLGDEGAVALLQGWWRAGVLRPQAFPA